MGAKTPGWALQAPQSGSVASTCHRRPKNRPRSEGVQLALTLLRLLRWSRRHILQRLILVQNWPPIPSEENLS